MADPARALDRPFTYGDYKMWPDDERWELIGGVAYQMSAPTRKHQALVGLIHGRLFVFLEGKPCKVYEAPFDVLLPSGQEPDDEVDTVVQPDIAVFCDSSKLTERGARGAPDLVVEILSPSTSRKDQREKFDRYERAGVREYWIVDPGNESIHAWLLGPEGSFGEEQLYEDGEAAPSAVLEGLVVDTKELFKDSD